MKYLWLVFLVGCKAPLIRSEDAKEMTVFTSQVKINVVTPGPEFRPIIGDCSVEDAVPAIPAPKDVEPATFEESFAPDNNSYLTKSELVIPPPPPPTKEQGKAMQIIIDATMGEPIDAYFRDVGFTVTIMGTLLGIYMLGYWVISKLLDLKQRWTRRKES